MVKINNPDELNIIIGQSHFIKTAEDIYEAMVNTVPNVKFGVAFCEASVNRLVRVEGNDDELKKLEELETDAKNKDFSYYGGYLDF